MSSFTRNISSVLGVNAAIGAVNFFAAIWFAKTLGLTAMGEYAAIVTILNLIAALFAGGFDQAVIRSPDDPSLVKAAYVAIMIQSVSLMVTSATFYAFYFVNNGAFNSQELFVSTAILFSLIFNLVGFFYAAPFAARLEHPFLTKMRLLAVLGGIGVGVILIKCGFGIYSLALRDLTISAVLLLLMYAKGKQVKAGATPDFRKLLRFSKSLWALNILERFSLRIDYAVVGLLLDKEILGLYFTIRGLAEGVLGFLVKPVQTIVYSYYCKSDHRSFRDFTSSKTVIFIYFLIVIFATVMASIFSSKLLLAALGPEFVGGAQLVPWLLLYCSGVLWFENEKVKAMSLNRHGDLTFIRSIQVVIVTISSAFLVYHFGINGVAIAPAAGSIVLGWLCYRRNQRYMACVP